MTRQMYDSLNPEEIPEDAEMVASYIDGSNAPAEGWEARFPHAVIVRIARIPSNDAGDVLDAGDNGVTPNDALEWVQMRRRAGADPALYTNAASWPSVRAAFVRANVGEPHYWIAQWDGQTAIPAGAVAKQYADSTRSGGDFDLSVVDDEWMPSAAAPPTPPAPGTGSSEPLPPSATPPAPGNPPAQDITWQSFTGTVQVESADVRVYPSVTAKVIRSYPEGTELGFDGFDYSEGVYDPVEHQIDHRWFHINHADGDGWIASGWINGNPENSHP